MTTAYSAQALIRGPDGGYGLRPDFDPRAHCVQIAFADAAPWGLAFDDAWHGNTEPPVAEIRTAQGKILASGHAYILERLHLNDGRAGAPVHIEVLAIGTEPVAIVSDVPLGPGRVYRAIGDDFAQAAAVRNAQALSGFGPDTRILTQDGQLPVEWLAPGDRIVTHDHGLQTLRWIGFASVSARKLADQPALRPVATSASDLDGTLPDDLLVLGPGTEMLLSGAEVELHFGCDRALARACDILEPATRRPALGGLTYFQLGFDAHEVVSANGVWCATPLLAVGPLPEVSGSALSPPAKLRQQRAAHPVLKPWEAQLWRLLRTARGRAKGVSRAA